MPTPEEVNPDYKPLYVDIGANMLDSMYSGIYRDKPRHEGDLNEVLKRAWMANVDRVVITAGTVAESKEALKLARELNDICVGSNSGNGKRRFFSTVGVHPTRCTEFVENLQEQKEEMKKVILDGISDGTVISIGELGLDYARTQFCDIDTQKKGFLAQLDIADEIKEEQDLPLFLHNRETGSDLYDLLKENKDKFTRGVVHSFDDTLELANKFIQDEDMDLYIGLNGCSLKTESNLEVARQIPVEKMLIETDCPWCDVRKTHAGYNFVKTHFPTKTEKKFELGTAVKNRNEPCHIVQIAEIISGAKSMDLDEFATICRKNSYDFYKLED
eukprot:CAMPEP_0178940616 /NCGR_PEP_ID=MMETSP0789-20121207/913_1 /TAXON_ID=3005 /ORGANISM="Rhizosolenia setigera, Strain CCMP 1694" /LENGTH=329 /DNA_ID=CAMNT_0020619685 /DNA_START=153 /DNA_END=1142 /DNA_ORIENTATION=+